MCHWEQTGAFTRKKWTGWRGLETQSDGQWTVRGDAAEAEGTESWQCAVLHSTTSHGKGARRSCQPDSASVNPVVLQHTLLSSLLCSLLNQMLGKKDTQWALPPMSPPQQGQSPAGFSILPISPSITSMSWSCIHEDQEESSASQLAHAALIPAAERAVKLTGSWADVLFFPAPHHCEWDTENHPNGNQFGFSLTGLEKGRWALPGFSTTFLAMDEKISVIHMPLSFRPGTRREDSLPILPWEGHLYCEQAKLILICPTLGCQSLSHICRSILLLWDGRELISKEQLLYEPQLWNCYFCEYGDDKIKNWFSDERVSKNVKQGLIRRTNTHVRNCWERRWRFKVRERVLGHQGVLPEKVKIEELNIARAVACILRTALGLGWPPVCF